MADPSVEEKIRGNMVVSSTGYCYSDVSSTNPNLVSHQLQTFESNPEIYNLTTGMELIGFPPKISPSHHHEHNSVSQHHHDHQDTNSIFWKGSSSKSINDQISGDFYHQFDQNSSRLLVDESSLRCVFPCEGNERPSQGLSLSLSSTNPSSIGLQSFELRQQDHHHHQGFFGKTMNIQQHQEIMQDGFLGKAGNMNGTPQYNHQSQQYQIRSSKYLAPAQELLNEFCNLGTKQSGDHSPKAKSQRTNQWQVDENSPSSSSKKQSLNSLELLELQKRKTKLLQMLEEVDRRYKHYCDQMKAVVSSFEAVAGNGAATVYSALASKAMSRHFRCLRDGIVGQIKATKEAMGEKDSTAAPGTTRGETPRLRLLDQTLRQQRAFQQMHMMESHPWRPQRGLPERSVSVLRAWLFEHFLHPYPSDVDKHILARQTGLSRSQVSNWFINARVRLWKPMVEEMYREETKDHIQENIEGSSDGFTALDPSQNPLVTRSEDQKPTQDQLVRIDSECLSSIINNPEKYESTSKNNTKGLQNDQQPHHHDFHQGFARVTDSFGAVELDFSSYNHHSASAASYENAHHHHFGGGVGGSGGGGGGGGGGVSLTLGLQQHSGGGVSLAFSPTSQNSLFYSRDQMEDCQTVQYSLLDGEAQNLPYRNLMGAQLLNDLAG